MAEEIYVRDGAIWRLCTPGSTSGFYVRHGGAWREPIEAHVKDGATWRRFYGRGILSLSSLNNNALNVAPAPYTGTAGFYFNTDGTIDRQNASGINQINVGDWITGSFVSSDYEFQWQNISNTINGASVVESTTVWTNMAAQQYILHNGTGGSGDTIRTQSVTIRKVSDTGDSVTQSYQIEAGGLN